jgi:glutamyl-tRNA(Gln) amidotransferase subunit E
VPSTAPVDLTEPLRAAAEGRIGEILRKGGVALGVPLPGFGGLLRPEPEAPERLGRELADAARSVGLKGLVHSDELPGYGLSPQDVDEVRRRLGVPSTQDAFVFVTASDPSLAARALERIRERARAALLGIPGETRDPLPEGRTRYSRPLPGRDRMYPETDVPPIPVDAERLERLRQVLPESPTETRRRTAERYGLPEELVRSMQRADQLDLFERLVAPGEPAGLVARLLTQLLPALEGADGAAVEIEEGRLAELLEAVRKGNFSKEGIPEVLAALAKGATDLPSAIAAAGLGAPAPVELDRLAEELVERNRSLLAARGDGAFAPLMGDLMKEVRGKRDGKQVAEALRRAIERARAA